MPIATLVCNFMLLAESVHFCHQTVGQLLPEIGHFKRGNLLLFNKMICNMASKI